MLNHFLQKALFLSLHFALAIPHKYMDDKLHSGSCCAFHQMNLISFWALTGCFSALFLVLVTEGFKECDSTLRKWNILEKFGASGEHLQTEKIMLLNRSHYMSSLCGNGAASSCRAVGVVPKLVNDWEISGYNHVVCTRLTCNHIRDQCNQD